MNDPGNALDAVVISGVGIPLATAGVPIEFTIDSRDATASAMLAACFDCSGYIVELQQPQSRGNLKCSNCHADATPELRNGTASGKITVFREGTWNMAVYVRNFATRVYMHIQGSPFLVQVAAGKVAPANCIASGGGLVGTSLRQTGMVIITTRDAWNNDNLDLGDVPANVMLALQGVFCNLVLNPEASNFFKSELTADLCRFPANCSYEKRQWTLFRQICWYILRVFGVQKVSIALSSVPIAACRIRLPACVQFMQLL